MGDRALIQIEDGDGEYSPVIYLHSNGSDIEKWIKDIPALSVGRVGDVSYTTARLIGMIHNRIPGNLSLGVWNCEGRLMEEDSHGDAGCFVYNCTTGACEAFGGYGKSFQVEMRERGE